MKRKSAIILFCVAVPACTLVDTDCADDDGSCNGAIAAGVATAFLPAVAATTTTTTPVPDPLPVSGAQLWLPAGFGLTQSGSIVTAWADQSGNNFDAVAPGGGAVLNSNAVNGQPALTFDGTSSNYILGSNYPFTEASSGGVVEGAIYTPTVHGGATTNFDVTATTADFVILSFRIEFGVEQRIYINGTSAANAAITTTALDAVTIREAPSRSANSGGPFSIGWQSKNGDHSRTFKGDIAELILYHSAMTDGDRQAIECHLSNKYAISVAQTCS